VIHAKIALQARDEPRRREARTSVSTDVPVRPHGQGSVDGRLVNISSRGFMIETDALIEPGARVWITLPGAGRVGGLVIWTRNGRIGGELAEAVDPLAVLHALGEETLF
jgi:hypothetical protein